MKKELVSKILIFALIFTLCGCGTGGQDILTDGSGIESEDNISETGDDDTGSGVTTESGSTEGDPTEEESESDTVADNDAGTESDTSVDTGSEDDAPTDTGSEDDTPADTGSEDDTPTDTGSEDDTPADTGSEDDSPVDTGTEDDTEADTGTEEKDSEEDTTVKLETTLTIPKVEGLADDFMMGVDISSLISLEASGRVFYGFDGKQQDIFKTLSQVGINYIRVRVWNDPFDAQGNGYGGGNCTVDTAIALGKRAAEYGMGLMVDFHYSDFWADPGKQQAPKAWANMTVDQKAKAMYDFTVESIEKIQAQGIKIGMVQVGNETTGGICGEKSEANIYKLLKSAAEAVRDTNPEILIGIHYTNPEKKAYSYYANCLKNYGVDYDVFASSYYPEYHGTMANLKEQLAAVHNIGGKKVMIAETSWSYSSDIAGAYQNSVQGQADEIRACVNAMKELGDYAIGVFYWEPAWIDVPGNSEAEKHNKREQYGAGWARSYAGSYDPNDAGKYYGATACVSTSLFSPDGYPLESLKAFYFVREGTKETTKNYVKNPSFEESDTSMWKITEAVKSTTGFQEKQADAKEGVKALHFWSDQPVEFCAEQTVTALEKGKYQFSLSVQGDGAGENAVLLIYVISDGKRYEQTFLLAGWANWQVPSIRDISCNSGTMKVGIEIKAAAGAWGTIDCVELVRAED